LAAEGNKYHKNGKAHISSTRAAAYVSSDGSISQYLATNLSSLGVDATGLAAARH